MSNAKAFRPVYAGPAGEVQVARDLVAVGANGRTLWEFQPDLAHPLPNGTDLLLMPGRAPLALDPGTGEAVAIEGARGPAFALAAALPVGYTRLLTPAAEDDGRGPDLPLFGYTAVAERGGRLFVAATRTDDPGPWAPGSFTPEALAASIAERTREFPGNRVLAQLSRCAREYHCRTAQNLFQRRGEAGLPAARHCNASCLGCISLQPAQCCPAPQSRLTFTPTERELSELAAAHLSASPEAMVSFGQGCEGEPLTTAPLLAAVIRAVRRRTDGGVINLNTNAGLTAALDTLIAAGLNSVRVSLFSAVPSDYAAYHRPSGFCLADVEASLRLAVTRGVRTSLNLLVYPGFTDSPRQTQALIDLCRRTGLHQLQLRNLNIDPRAAAVFLPRHETPGILELLGTIRRELPGLAVGNYSRAC